MKANFIIRFLVGTVFLVLFNFQMVCSDDHTGRIPDDVRLETRDYYTYCISHREYGIDIYELNENTFVSDLDTNEFQVEVKPSCNFSRRLNDTDTSGPETSSRRILRSENLIPGSMTMQAHQESSLPIRLLTVMQLSPNMKS